MKALRPASILLCIVLLNLGFQLPSFAGKKSKQKKQMVFDGKVDPEWVDNLQSKVERLAKSFSGEFGLMVKDLDSGKFYATNASSPWYLASSIKLFVAVETMRRIEAGLLKMDSKYELKHSHYRDGAGRTNWKKPGEKLSVKYLLEQMMIESDNAATDMLIDAVGIHSVNATLKEIAPKGFWIVTSLLDVRKLAYSYAHPRARNLSNMDYLKIKKAKRPDRKMRKLASLLGVSRKELKIKNLDETFEEYYKSRVNHGTLEAYTKILERLAKGKMVSPTKDKMVLEIMSRCKTGKRRIVHGMGPSLVFAHKTGTQHKRACDMGILRRKITNEKSLGVSVTLCTKKFKSLRSSDRIFSKIGKAIAKSGVFGKLKPR